MHESINLDSNTYLLLAKDLVVIYRGVSPPPLIANTPPTFLNGVLEASERKQFESELDLHVKHSLVGLFLPK